MHVAYVCAVCTYASVYLDGNLVAIAGGTVDRACSTPPHKIPHLHILPPPTDTYNRTISTLTSFFSKAMLDSRQASSCVIAFHVACRALYMRLVSATTVVLAAVIILKYNPLLYDLTVPPHSTNLLLHLI